MATAAHYGEFSLHYQEELASNKNEVTRLQDLMKQGLMTLLYAAHDEKHGHALVVADCLRNHWGQR